MVIANVITELLGEGLSEVFSTLVSGVESIVSVVEGFGSLVAWGLVTAWNGLVHAIDLAIEHFFALLPTLPSPPSIGSSEALKWFNWIVPVPTMLTIWFSMLLLWFVWLGLRIVLRWIKAD